MNQTSSSLFGTEGLLPLGASMGWQWSLLILHALSDGAIAASFFVLAAAIGFLTHRRRDLPRGARRAAALFMVVFLSAGATHLLGLIELWVTIHALQGIFKALTAGAALATAVMIWPLIPKLLALPSPRDLARANHALVQSNASLETTIAWRTHEIDLARQRFEQALSRSNITVFTQDTDLRYTWIHNPRLGLTEEDLLGRTTEEILPDGTPDETVTLKRKALAGETGSATVAYPSGDGGSLYLDMTVSPTVDKHGKIDGILCTAIDVTEMRLFEVRLTSMATQLATAYQRFELAFENSAITVFEQNADLRYTYMYNPPAGMRPDDFLDRTDADIFPPGDLPGIVGPKQRVLQSGGRENVELEVEVAGVLRFFDLTLEAQTDELGAVLGLVGTALDLTDRRQDEKRIRLMLRELTHRSKNLLAVIQAMARKTASMSGDIDSFVVDFSARLRAMAAAHDLLVSQSWNGADLGELLRASVAQTIAPTAEQVQMTGPPLMLAPDTAQNLSLAFHELATNASKYGALAADEGELAVTWCHKDGEVRISWRESGGPTVTPPEHRGFGRVLLERLVGATLNGSVTLDFRPEGLVCDIVFPHDRLNARWETPEVSSGSGVPAHG